MLNVIRKLPLAFMLVFGIAGCDAAEKERSTFEEAADPDLLRRLVEADPQELSLLLSDPAGFFDGHGMALELSEVAHIEGIIHHYASDVDVRSLELGFRGAPCVCHSMLDAIWDYLF